MAVLQPFKAKVVFDSPLDKVSEHGPYHVMTLDLPSGAPGTKWNDEYGRNEAWMNFDADFEGADYLKSLSRGDEMDVVWNGKKYVPIIPSPPPGSEPAKKQESKPKDNGEWLSGNDVNKTRRQPEEQRSQDQEQRPPKLGNKEKEFYLVRYGVGVINTLAKFAKAVQGVDVFSEQPAEEQNRIAITAFIEANRNSGRAPDLKIYEALEEEVRNLDPERLPENFLEFVVATVTGYDSPVEVGKALKELDITREDLKPDDPESWVQIYRIARRYANYSFNN